MFGYLLITDLQRIYGLLLTEPAGFNDVRWGAAYQIIRITIAASLLSGIIGRALSQRLRKMRLVPWTFHLLYIACAVDVL